MLAVFALSCVGLPLFWYRGKRFVLVQVGICVLEVSLLRFLMKFTNFPKEKEEEEEEEILQIVLPTCNLIQYIKAEAFNEVLTR